MSRFTLLVGVLVWVGATLVLLELRWFRRPPLVERLRPYTSGASPRPVIPARRLEAGVLASLRELSAPIAERLGGRLSGWFGVHESISTRLERVHDPIGASGFRVSQVGRSVAVGALVTIAALAGGASDLLLLVSGIGAALLTFLFIEQQLANRSVRWQRQLFLELPVVCEQLGMLLAAGYSLGQALSRLAERGDAAIARDLRRVVGRLRQGIDEDAALREWRDLAQVPALDRLLAVLALNREATDLGSLIVEEARALRTEVHRELIERIERRGQQVWIPVTVATLVPGVLFLAVPFIEAMRLFTTT